MPKTKGKTFKPYEAARREPDAFSIPDVTDFPSASQAERKISALKESAMRACYLYARMAGSKKIDAQINLLKRTFESAD